MSRTWSNRQRYLKQWRGLGLVAIALLLVLLTNLWIMQSYRVEGTSMMPTLADGDHLVVWKAGRTWAGVFGQNYVPERGQIIVFKHPDNSSVLIKRVIGLPTEQIEIKNGRIVIYNRDYPAGFSPDIETGPGVIPPQNEDQIWPRLASDEVFVIGDNRIPNKSTDSRQLEGIKTEDIIGTLTVRILPLGTWRFF